jgi:hypothetical protein
MKRTGHIHRKLQISGALVILGLLVEAVCLLWSRPIAFVIFAGLGGFLIATGVLLFLYSLVFVVSQGKEAVAADKNEASYLNKLH